MILFRTLLNRNLWLNPLSNVMGGWGIWETVNGEQKLTTECIENVIMMVPFTSMVIWTFREKIGNGWKKILWQSGKIAFGFSLMMVSAFIENVYVHEGGRIVVQFKYEQSIRLMPESREQQELPE